MMPQISEDFTSNIGVSTPTSLSASIIFSKKEMKHYLQWQRQTLNPKRSRTSLGHLPTAAQYHEFTTWCEARKQRQQQEDAYAAFSGAWQLSRELEGHLNPKSLTSVGEMEHDVQSSTRRDRHDSPQEQEREAQPIIARSCKHPLHPCTSESAEDNNGGAVDTCPCCIISTHLKYMNLLSAVVSRTEDDSLSNFNADGEHGLALRAWHAGKLELVRAVCKFEKIGCVEAEWEALHPLARVDDCMSAMKAVRMYWDSVDCSTKRASSDEEISNKEGSSNEGISPGQTLTRRFLSGGQAHPRTVQRKRPRIQTQKPTI
jgi:hypothetical protein